MNKIIVILEDMLRKGRIDSLKVEEALEYLEGILGERAYRISPLKSMLRRVRGMP